MPTDTLAADATASTPTSDAHLPSPPAEPRRHRAVLAVFAVVAVTALLALAFVVGRTTAADTSPAPAPVVAPVSTGQVLPTATTTADCHIPGPPC